MNRLKATLILLATFFLLSWTLELTAEDRVGGSRVFRKPRFQNLFVSVAHRAIPLSVLSLYSQPQRSMGQTFGGGGMMRNVLAGVAGGLLGGMLFRSLALRDRVPAWRRRIGMMGHHPDRRAPLRHLLVYQTKAYDGRSQPSLSGKYRRCGLRATRLYPPTGVL